MQKITSCLWFDGNAEEAVRFYVSIFKDSFVDTVLHYTEAGPGPAGSVLTIAFRLNGQSFLAINGGPQYPFTPAVSFIVPCESQQEVDYYWDKLSAGGKEVQCGWLADKFGVSWQVTPVVLPIMLQDPDKKKADSVMKAMLKMVKLDIATLTKAYDGG